MTISIWAFVAESSRPSSRRWINVKDYSRKFRQKVIQISLYKSYHRGARNEQAHRMRTVFSLFFENVFMCVRRDYIMWIHYIEHSLPPSQMVERNANKSTLDDEHGCQMLIHRASCFEFRMRRRGRLAIDLNFHYIVLSIHPQSLDDTELKINLIVFELT